MGGSHHDPHSILGAHPTGDGRTVIRTLRPDATSVELVVGKSRAPLGLVHDGGVYEAIIDGPPPDYRLDVTYGSDHYVVDDPYRWLPTLGDIDLHLIGEGRHEQLWDVLGAHVRTYDTPGGPVTGTSFAVWAPNARGVRVAGDFNFWMGHALPMRSLGSSGVWELFVPEVGDGARYKFQVLGADSEWRDKADPMAFATEVPPATASVVHEDRYDWRDEAWLERRAQTDWVASPMSIYEVHLGSWKLGLSYRELASELVDYIRDTGFTHVEFLPVAEHPFGGSWGYQVSSYYAPSARFGKPDEFRYLVDELHRAGIGVIVDWVPAHFPKDAWALSRFDGTPLYEHADPRRGEQPDWGTYVFDFGRAEVRNFLVANALYWLEEFHIDGLRVDAVASMLYLDYSRNEGEWVPNVHGGRENLEAVSFLQEMNATVYKRVPGAITIAEESTSWPGVTRATHLGGLGFGFKWNMGWMHDTLDYLSRAPVYRQYHHNDMTFSMMYAYSENFVLPISHDEVVHGKGSMLNKIPGDRWQQMATLRAAYAFMWAHPGKQLLFMGQEFGAGPRVGRVALARLVAARRPGSSRRAAADQRPEPRLHRDRRAVVAGQRPGRLPLDRRERRLGQRLLVPAVRFGRLDRRLHRELLGRPARGLPRRPAPRRTLGRGHQHRRRCVLRLGRRQLRRRRGPRAAMARPAGVGGPARAAARGAVAAFRRLISRLDPSIDSVEVRPDRYFDHGVAATISPREDRECGTGRPS